jgi:hypothetical protein
MIFGSGGFFDDGTSDPVRNMAYAILNDEHFAPVLQKIVEETVRALPKEGASASTKRSARSHIFKAISEIVEKEIASKIVTLHPTTRRMFYFRSRHDRLTACLIATDKIIKSVYG